ncbi:MAG: hypothetical protein WCG80_02100 [Spirochaetales bacterium]
MHDFLDQGTHRDFPPAPEPPVPVRQERNDWPRRSDRIRTIIGSACLATSALLFAWQTYQQWEANSHYPDIKFELAQPLPQTFRAPTVVSPHLALAVDFNTRIQGRWYHLDFYQAHAGGD